MYTNLTALLITACVAFAAQISFSGNLDDQMDDLLEKLETNLNYTILSTDLELIEYLYSMNSTDAISKKDTSAALYEMRVIWESKIDGLKQRALNESVNIDECLGQNAKTLINLTAVYETEDYRCIKGHENRIMNEANNTYHRIHREMLIIPEIKREIQLCEQAEACVKRITERIQTESRRLPSEIMKEAKQTVNLIQDIVSNDISRCGKESIDRCETNGSILLAKITSCVDRKIGH